MAQTRFQVVAAQAIVVEEAVEFTLDGLCRACTAERAQVLALVDQGLLQPSGSEPADWRFGGAQLPAARAALRLARDLELDVAGAALVVDLLQEIDTLRAQLRRVGAGG